MAEAKTGHDLGGGGYGGAWSKGATGGWSSPNGGSGFRDSQGNPITPSEYRLEKHLSEIAASLKEIAEALRSLIPREPPEPPHG